MIKVEPFVKPKEQMHNNRLSKYVAITEIQTVYLLVAIIGSKAMDVPKHLLWRSAIY